MELINPDEGSNGTTWTFRLPAGKERIVRRLAKKDHDKVGVDYKIKVSAGYKFI